MLRNVFCCAVGLAMASCVATDGSDTVIPSWEEFRATVHRDSTGAFIVDGDIPIRSEAQLRGHYDAYVRSALEAEGGYGVASSALTINTVNGEDDRWIFPAQYRLTYCISADFGDQFDTVVDNMRDATTSWSKIAGVRFEYVEQTTCTSQSNNVTFNVRPVHGEPYFARAFFPGEARADRELLIEDAAFTTTEGGRDFQGILRHELGHTLGFRHEHIRLEVPCTSEQNSENRTLTDYDVDSVMHYPQCRPSGTGGYRQSPIDYAGAVSVYGLAPALQAAM